MPITTTIQARVAAYSDAAAMLAVDDGGRLKRERTNFINQAITNRNAHVATLEGRVVAYGVLQQTFFNHSFISLLSVHPDHRRHRVGAWLLQHIEAACKTPKLFTTLAASNLPAQAFFLKLGYSPSGHIENLDDPEPQAIFFKKLR